MALYCFLCDIPYSLLEFNPLLAHLRKDSPFPHSRVEETSVHRVGSGRSPFFSRLQSPVIQNKIRSKSVSPPMLNCMSPYSQIVNSNSWSTLYEESATGHLNVDPLVPQLLLQQLWEEARYTYIIFMTVYLSHETIIHS